MLILSNLPVQIHQTMLVPPLFWRVKAGVEMSPTDVQASLIWWEGTESKLEKKSICIDIGY